MGKPRQRAVDILGLQHQSGRCGSRASGRTSKQSIANGGGPPHPEDRSIAQEAGLPRRKAIRGAKKSCENGTAVAHAKGGVFGIVGALIGDWLLHRLGVHFDSGIIGLVINATIGAIVFLLPLRLIGASGWGGR
jgi:uncharacterized membrane protein YeaQ/YmgE (transglycosylase-associated protein family)